MTEAPLAVCRQPVLGWGMAVGGLADVLRPTTQDDVLAIVQWARQAQRPIALRGAGCSYGDAACGALIVDMSGVNRILHWDPQTGLIRCEAGATIGDVWHHTVAQGWWPPVVSGTMAPTLGGAAAMNIHGKNAFRAGPIGEHITALKVLLMSGEVRELVPTDPLFRAVISGFGELAVILEVALQLKRVHAGTLQVWAKTAANLDSLFAFFENHAASADYLVAWLDAFATGQGLGRSLIHAAYHRKPGQEVANATALQVHNQELPPRLFGVIPKSWMWRLLWPFSNQWGMRLVNIARYWSGRLLAEDKRYWQSHAAFHFLLDYVPNWKFAYKPGGLIQHQIFVPRAAAKQVFAQVLQLQQARGLVTLLAVVKRHRADDFLLSHGLDGYSLAQDFAVTSRNRDTVWQLCHDMDAIVAAAGGKVYFAKDATVQPHTVLAMFGRERLQHFAQLRERLDPQGLLATAQWLRAVQPAVQLALQANDEIR